MKDRELNSAIKRASPRRRPWAKFNASPPFPSFNSWPFSSSSSLTSHSAPIESRWSLSRNSPPPPPQSSFFPSSAPLSHFWNHDPGPNPTGRNPVPGDIGVPGNLSTYIGCAAHILSCAAPQSSIGPIRANRSRPWDPKSFESSSILQHRCKRNRQKAESNVRYFACLFKTIEFYPV